MTNNSTSKSKPTGKWIRKTTFNKIFASSEMPPQVEGLRAPCTTMLVLSFIQLGRGDNKKTGVMTEAKRGEIKRSNLKKMIKSSTKLFPLP